MTRQQAASLRCYLAVSDLAAYALDGKQLSPESLVESARIWLARNACHASWFERLTIAIEAQTVAKTVLEANVKSGDDIQPARLFTDAMTVNYADPLVAKVWRRCSRSEET
ncbi:hypothetical protein [Paraburkholderia sp. GAS33]|uniref:hypothetical protein n=1 Tax=Paraburkholderia sp. GAS33 TaxID=3035130 RepID=UPI003D2469E9